MDIKQVFRTLSEASGVSGCEAELAQHIQEACPWADELRTDKLGNLIMLKKGQSPGPRPKVMLAAHMDEIGLIVTKIEEDGFLRFSTIGGFDQRVLLAQEVVVHGSKTHRRYWSKPLHQTRRTEESCEDGRSLH